MFKQLEQLFGKAGGVDRAWIVGGPQGILYGGGGLGQEPRRMELEALKGFQKGSCRIKVVSILAASCSLVGQEMVVGVLTNNES